MKTATAPLPPLRSVKVLDQLRERIRYLHYSLRTEQAYVNWVRAFIRFHGVRHPATLGSSEVEAFLSALLQIVGGDKLIIPFADGAAHEPIQRPAFSA